ncbi:MAG: dienelactone hydrolase family protein [Armatimonadetes bacterium]|nr:dienelactone hydrolase family protein [Armatimonadota bacterium]
MPRYLSGEDGMKARLAATPRPLHFAGKNPAEWAVWRRRLKRALETYLGPTPEPVDLNPEVSQRTDCGSYYREHVIFDSEAFASVTAWVLTPKSATAATPAPGILCLHGHGPHGKDALVGVNVHGEPIAQEIYHCQAVELAEQGYVVIAPDWRGFGERADRDWWVRRPSRDGCNVLYLAAGYFGYHLLALQIHDGQRTLDYLLTRPEVRPDRIGAIGLSFGGTMTTWLAALDERITCAVIGCYLSTLEDGLARGNFCGAQYAPGLATVADIADVAGLIAPRPCQAQIGEQDLCFTIDDAAAACDHVARIYAAAGVPERFETDRFGGGHEFDPPAARDWFARWLKAGSREAAPAAP